ncbi:transposase domain-containing protein, partial [Frankia sp. ACN1ag]
MDSGEEPSLAGRLTDHISVGVLARVIPRDAVDEVLTETGRREKRVRLLPAHVVVYFVVALAVFRDGYEEVLRRLVGGLRFMAVWR